MADVPDLLTNGALWAGLGIATSKVLDWLAQRRRDGAETAAKASAAIVEVRRLDTADRGQAVAELIKVVEVLRNEMRALQEDLEEEREARREAEEKVRALRDELQALRSGLQMRGIQLPGPPPPEATPGAS